jgi:hypothetical protein
MNKDMRKIHFDYLINDQTTTEAYNFKKENIPKKLYRYCGLISNIYIQSQDESKISEKSYLNLLFNTWYFSKATDFDDIFDCDINVKNVNFIEVGKEKLRVLCFSEEKNNELMWSLYANKHKGFCVEYDIEKMEYSFRGMFYPVYYSNEKYNLNLKKYDRNNFLASYIKKSEAWYWQTEWRIIMHQFNYNNVQIGTTEEINAFAPISAIYLGLRISTENEKVFKDLCFAHKIKLMKANTFYIVVLKNSRCC